jgi:hypothetical protein
MKEWTPPADLPQDVNRPAVDRHTSFLFEAQQMGKHVHVKVRAATRGHDLHADHSRALLGTLAMLPEEWFLLRSVLEAADTPGPQWVDDEVGRVFIIAGAGCLELGEDHAAERFIETVTRWSE